MVVSQGKYQARFWRCTRKFMVAIVYVPAVEKQDILQGNASSKAQSASSVGSKTIWQKCERAHNFEVTVKINSKSSQIELDTGAAVTIVTPQCWKSIGSLKLKRATVMLRSFTVHKLNQKGETMLTVERDTEVFEYGLGHCTKVKAHVELKSGAVPVFQKPFPLAFTMHDAVKKELERYVDMGVLTLIYRSA
ncbi:Uncharacterized protein TPS_00005 [Trichinella pseudospiralis]